MSSMAAWLIGMIVLCLVSAPSAQGGGDPTSTIIAVSVVGSVVGLLVLVVIGIFSYKFAKKVVPDILKELRNTSTPPPAELWGVDSQKMEKFFREIADESPVRFTAQQLHAFTSNYSTRLGSGGFGDVYKGQFPNGVEIAVKVLKSSDKKAEEQFMAEVGTIGRTRHKNLVRLYGYCYDESMSAVVLEYMENGSLDNFLFGQKNGIEWEKLQKIAVGTAMGIAYLHEECQRRIIHYDIKPANILLDANFSPKVGDFGLANLCNRDNTHISIVEYRGTPGYSAPELWTLNFPVTFKCDVYSFGMVLFEIVGRRKNAVLAPSGSIDWFPIQVWNRLEKGELAETIAAYDIEDKEREKAINRMCKVALWCVQYSPAARPPMSVVVKMLEGSVDIMPPQKPFQYMYPNSTEGSAVTIAITEGSSGSTLSYEMSTESSLPTPTWYKDSAPILTT